LFFGQKDGAFRGAIRRMAGACSSGHGQSIGGFHLFLVKNVAGKDGIPHQRSYLFRQ
jgi:hypothetical protein